MSGIIKPTEKLIYICVSLVSTFLTQTRQWNGYHHPRTSNWFKMEIVTQPNALRLFDAYIVNTLTVTHGFDHDKCVYFNH